jgi:hypothetical protein
MGKVKTELNGKVVVSTELSVEYHEIAAEMIADNMAKFGSYTLEEVTDREMVNVWIADAFSEGNTEYARMLQDALAKNADIYTLTDHLGEFSQPISEVVVY